jgi:hypothetical protein
MFQLSAVQFSGAHVWTAPSAQELSECDVPRSGALMCPAC